MGSFENLAVSVSTNVCDAPSFQQTSYLHIWRDSNVKMSRKIDLRTIARKGWGHVLFYSDTLLLILGGNMFTSHILIPIMSP